MGPLFLCMCVWWSHGCGYHSWIDCRLKFIGNDIALMNSSDFLFGVLWGCLLCGKFGGVVRH